MKRIAFQGVFGAYSHLAVKSLFPEGTEVPCSTFEDALEAVENNEADFAVLPIENSTAGRVAGLHSLMPHTSLEVMKEFYLPIKHCLLGINGSKLSEIRLAYSHEQALAQSKNTLRGLGIKTVSFADTAGAAKMIADKKDTSNAAVASAINAEIYGLKILQENIQDIEHNTTRFFVLTKSKPLEVSEQLEEKLVTLDTTYKTTFIFETRSIPSALYKALGSFATNNVNLIKLESYIEGEDFEISKFFVEIEENINNIAVKSAFKELEFYSKYIKILGSYPKANSRT